MELWAFGRSPKPRAWPRSSGEQWTRTQGLAARRELGNRNGEGVKDVSQSTVPRIPGKETAASRRPETREGDCGEQVLPRGLCPPGPGRSPLTRFRPPALRPAPQPFPSALPAPTTEQLTSCCPPGCSDLAAVSRLPFLSPSSTQRRWPPFGKSSRRSWSVLWALQACLPHQAGSSPKPGTLFECSLSPESPSTCSVNMHGAT